MDLPDKAQEPGATAWAEEKLTDSEQQEIVEKARQFVRELSDLSVSSEGFTTRLDMIRQMGAAAIRQASGTYQRFMQEALVSGQGKMVEAGDRMSALRLQLDGLNPRNRGNLEQPKKLFGFIPLGNPVEKLFKDFQDQQLDLNEKIQELLRLKDKLMQGNAHIDVQKAETRDLLHQLKKYQALARQIEASLADLMGAGTISPERHQILEEQVLFNLRQRQQDLATNAIVNMQAYQALSLLQENNRTLVQGIETLTGTTLKALQTAIMAASALTRQRLNLSKIAVMANQTRQQLREGAEYMRQEQRQLAHQTQDTSASLVNLQTAMNQVNAVVDQVTDTQRLAQQRLQDNVAAIELG